MSGFRVPWSVRLTAVAAMLAMAASGCGRAGNQATRGAGGLTPAGPASVPATRRPTPAAGRRSRCADAQLTVRLIRSGAATGHAGATLAFTNRGRATCVLTGWPEVVAVTAAGNTTVASHVRSTFFGPFRPSAPHVLTAPPRVVLGPGRRAEAILGGVDFPLHGDRCPSSYRRLRVTPPGGGRARVISGWLPGLGSYLPACAPIEISPVVPPGYLR